MTFNELVEAASKATFDEASIKAIQEALNESEIECVRIQKEREVTQEVLNRVISI